MLVELHVYRKSDGMFLYKDIGNPNYVISDLGDDKDFTLKAIPLDGNTYYWYDGDWNKSPKEQP